MAIPRVQSRLIRSERRKMTKQIMWFGGLTLGLIALFLFVVLPLFIRFVNSVLETNPIADNQMELLLQAPVIAAPPTATNSAQLTISGATAPEMVVMIVLNSSNEGEVRVAEDGTFSTQVRLIEGENTIVLFGRDDAGVETRTSREYLVVLDTSPPELEVTKPEENQQLSGKNLIEISGTTEFDARVYIDGRVISPRSDGGFSHTVQRDRGEHSLEIRAVDPAGNETVIVRSFTVVD